MGFRKNKKGGRDIYKVEHPLWETSRIINFGTNFDFGRIYGEKWSILNNALPFNVCFAKGSSVKVYKSQEIN